MISGHRCFHALVSSARQSCLPHSAQIVMVMTHSLLQLPAGHGQRSANVRPPRLAKAAGRCRLWGWWARPPAPGLLVVDLGGALLACATGVVRPQLPAGTAKLARVPAGDCGHTDRNCGKLPVDLHDSPVCRSPRGTPWLRQLCPLTRISSGLASCIRGRSPSNSAQIRGKRSRRNKLLRVISDKSVQTLSKLAKSWPLS